jgi:adenylate cyclase
MALEIERKFLVTNTTWREGNQGILYRQGYVPTQDKTTVRVRVAGDHSYLTVKGPSNGIVRTEYEYEIPLADAEAMLAEICQPPLIEKRRYKLPVANHLWEIDEFLGDNQGLLLAEIELTSPTETFVKPAWLGVEVSHDARYRNSYLARHPYSTWDSIQ